MPRYLRKKEELRQEAIEFKQYIIDNDLPWWDYYDALEEFLKEARKYGLIREFKNNQLKEVII